MKQIILFVIFSIILVIFFIVGINNHRTHFTKKEFQCKVIDKAIEYGYTQINVIKFMEMKSKKYFVLNVSIMDYRRYEINNIYTVSIRKYDIHKRINSLIIQVLFFSVLVLIFLYNIWLLVDYYVNKSREDLNIENNIYFR